MRISATRVLFGCAALTTFIAMSACGGGGGGESDKGGLAPGGGTGPTPTGPANTIQGHLSPEPAWPFFSDVADMESDSSQASPNGIEAPLLNEQTVAVGTLTQGSDEIDSFTMDGSANGQYRATLAFSGFTASTNLDLQVTFDNGGATTPLLTLNALALAKETNTFSVTGVTGASIVFDVSATSISTADVVSYYLKVEKFASSPATAGRVTQKSAAGDGRDDYVDGATGEGAAGFDASGYDAGFSTEPVQGPLVQHTWSALRNRATVPHGAGLAIVAFKQPNNPAFPFGPGGTDPDELLARAGMRKRMHIVAIDAWSIEHEDREALKDTDPDLLAARVFSAVNYLSAQKTVKYAEMDVLHTASLTPADQLFGTQAGHYDQCNLRTAWDTTTGSPNVTVAVLDTGLFGCGVSKPVNSEFTNRLRDSRDFISITDISLDGDGIDANAEDVGDLHATPLANSSWHGTHVAGTIGANTGTDAKGVCGADFQCKLMICRVLGSGGGTSTDIENAILYAANLANGGGTLPAGGKAQVINMSLGSNFPLQSFQAACTAAFNAGVVICGAAGNDGTSAFAYPASYSGVISVGALNRDNTKASFSQFNSAVDIAAPGVSVLSTFVADQSGPASESVNFLQGTSMATPHVAGICSLILSVDPALTPTEVENILYASAVDIGAPGRDNSFGNGLINAAAAVQAADTTPPGPPQISISPRVLDFRQDEGLTSKTLSLVNAGGSQLDVSATEIQKLGGENWLTGVNLSPSGSSSFSLTVSVSFSGLPAGLYAATIEVTSNSGGGTQVDIVPVFLYVGSPSPFNHRCFVAVFDDQGIKVQASQTTPAANFAFSFTGLAAGFYTVGAWGDDNDNGVYENGDETVGAFPSIDSPQRILVTNSNGQSGLVFPVNKPLQ